MSNFKLGIRAIHQKSIKSAILEAAKNGFEVLEIHLSSPQFLPQNHKPNELLNIKTFAEKNNIILQVHSELNSSLIQADDIMRKAEKSRLERVVKFCRQIKARSLTLHPGSSPAYYLGNDSKVLKNDDMYSNFYNQLFEESLKHIISISSKDLFICIENTDNFTLGYRKILNKHLKSNKVFITWDILKSLSFKTGNELSQEQWKFLKETINHVRNIHISGPHHGSMKGVEQNYIKFLELFKHLDIPIIIEAVSLETAVETRNLIRNLGF